jgi:subtilisin family serine protease
MTGVATLAAVIAACAPSAPAATAPSPSPAPTPSPALREAPLNWHLLDAVDRVSGISLLRAERELLAGKQPKRTVLVAVIDNGVDTAHAALRGRLWSNAKEIAGNGRDDDNNGYTDDTRGWNLIGGRDGRNVKEDTYELTRIVAQCGRPAGKDSLPTEYRTRCADLETEWSRKRAEISQTLTNVKQYEAVVNQIVPILKRAAGTDSLTRERVEAINATTDSVRRARQVFLQLAANGITPQDIYDAKKQFESQEQYGYNLKFDPRPIVGDNYPDTSVKRYGNRDVTGPDPEHGTHVAGIIAAERVNGGQGSLGIARQSVQIMGIRTVPDGDERDKDIAFAIRYAVDQGANVINMSFGKAYSPYKGVVDAAVKYADSKGVLMVHGSGNDGKDLASTESFPSPVYKDGTGRAVNWIEVGASSWKSNDSLVANFSNYGKAQVDVFAPGVDIYSTLPGGGYKKNSGTSMASPVVAGLAALIMSYYPTLTAADVKRVILESATRMGDKVVLRPGDVGGSVRFGDLSVTGGIVNAYTALRMAEDLSRTRP